MSVQTPPDLLGWLTGTWSIDRTINGRAGAFTGTARFAPDAATGALRWEERGQLVLDAYEGPASRVLFVVPEGDAYAVTFDNGRPFHALDLASAGGADAFHPCGPDAYTGRYEIVGPDELLVTWRVLGPGRDDTIVTRYARAAG